MRHRNYAACAVAAFVLTLGIPAATRAQAQDQAEDPAVKIDPAAIDALNKMGTYLRTLPAFEVRGEITTEEVLDDGEKVQIGKVVNLIAQKPNRLRVEITSDKQHRILFYNGKTFTVFAPRPGFFTTVAAPATIRELVDTLDNKYALELPFVDLFRWGTDQSNVADITNATDIGPAVIDGVTCEHYAFRQAGLDWQIWIQNGDFPLPRKLVLTTLTDEARPQYAALYTWNLAPSADATAFEFTAPKDAQKITMADGAVLRAALKQ